MTAVQIHAATAEDAPLVASILGTAFAEYESLYTAEAHCGLRLMVAAP